MVVAFFATTTGASASLPVEAYSFFHSSIAGLLCLYYTIKTHKRIGAGAHTMPPKTGAARLVHLFKIGRAHV